MLYTGNPNDTQFRQPPTYAAFLKSEIDNIGDFAAIRFFAAKADNNYDSVLAVGLDEQGQILNPTGNSILFDNLPCPPECHNPNVANPPTSNIWLWLGEAQQRQQQMPPEYGFSALFQSGEIKGLWTLTALYKIRVFYALTNGTPTFLILGVDSAGNNLPDIYLLDPYPQMPTSIEIGGGL